VDPATPVARWGLSTAGFARARRMLAQPWTDEVDRIVSSDEVKAVETAELLAECTGLPVEVRPGIGENDRTATGFLPPEEFDATADRFFAEPEASVRGWERAVDAQARVVAALADLLDPDDDRTTVVVGHGGVGTLWYCWLTGHAIDRRHDQPDQGHYFTVEVSTRQVRHAWRPIDYPS
jgi:broad specificity phosphatase PhoE